MHDALLGGSHDHRLLIVSILIAATHYTGMAAMRLQAISHYDGLLVALSVALAMLISAIALFLACRLRAVPSGRIRHEFPGATVMGALMRLDAYRPDLAGVTIKLWTSSGHSGDSTRCRELSIAAYLTKPVRQRQLLRTATPAPVGGC